MKFYQLHSEAHNDLALAGEPISDGMKITHFIAGLKENDAQNFAILSKSEYGVNTFEEFYNSFSAKLSTKLTLTRPQRDQTSNRQINQVNINNGGRGGRGGRNSTRGGGRSDGCSNGRNGRGRANGRFGGRFRHDPTSRSWRPRSGEYSAEEWGSLTPEQRQRVHDLRNSLRNMPRSQEDQRRVQQVSQDDETIPSQVQLPPQARTRTPPPPPSDSGSMRSRGGRVGDAFSQHRNNSN